MPGQFAQQQHWGHENFRQPIGDRQILADGEHLVLGVVNRLDRVVLRVANRLRTLGSGRLSVLDPLQNRMDLGRISLQACPGLVTRGAGPFGILESVLRFVVGVFQLRGALAPVLRRSLQRVRVPRLDLRLRRHRHRCGQDPYRPGIDRDTAAPPAASVAS